MMNEAEDLTNDEVSPIVEKINKLPVSITAHDNVQAIMPRDIDEAFRFAKAKALSGVIPDVYRDGKGGPPNEALIMMGCLKAMELGVPPQTGLDGLLPINGRWAVWGDLAQALVHRTGQIAKFQKKEIGAENFDPGAAAGLWPDAYGYRVMIWRRGQEDPYVGEFTVRDAKRAGLWMAPNRQPWVKYPQRMLFNRARAFALRDGFADGLSGLSIAEEVVDSLPPPVEERGGSAKTSLLIDNTEASDEAGA